MTIISTYCANIIPASLAHSCCEESIPYIFAVFLGSLESCSALPGFHTFIAYRINAIQLGIGSDCRFHDESINIFEQKFIL